MLTEKIILIISLSLSILFFILFIKQKKENYWLWVKILAPTITIIEQTQCKCKKEIVLNFVKDFEKYKDGLDYYIVLENGKCFLKSEEDNSLIEITESIINEYIKSKEKYNV